MSELILKLKMLWLYRGLFAEWKADVWQHKAHERMCCDGRECGCYGSDWGEWWGHLWANRAKRS